MKRRTVPPLFLATVLLLAACSAENAKSTDAESAATKRPSCSGQAYAKVKKGDVDKVQVASHSGPLVMPPIDDAGNAGKILQQTMPLGVPPEIMRIRRGIEQRFIGTFINDGLKEWSAVDLDRMLAVMVSRRTHDQLAPLSRPFSDPDLSQPGNPRFARKWSDEELTELEVVTVYPLSADQAEALVCAANAQWAAEEPQQRIMITDGFMSLTLSDRGKDHGIEYDYSKSVAPDRKLSDALKEIWGHTPPGNSR